MKFKIILYTSIAVLAAAVIGWYAMRPVAPAAQPVMAVIPTVTIPSHSVAAVLIIPPDDTLNAANAPTVAPAFKPYAFFVHIPPDASVDQPLQVVVALHGIGGEGKSFSASLVKEADRHHWLLIAPTITYGDWYNPETVVAEDMEITQRLAATINALPSLTGHAVRPRVDVYGFSRGAQVAHRFALFFPEKVDHVAAFSAGTYTLPFKSLNVGDNGRPDKLSLPYGVGDLGRHLGHAIDPQQVSQVRFFIGVGGADNAATDVPRQWDTYLGRTRVERAREFTGAMQRAGMHCTLQVFPGVGHEVTLAMLNQAVLFFADVASSSLSHLN
ncbi:MAG: hypothetical protein ABI874_05780 [Chloroflexota bacterium]